MNALLAAVFAALAAIAATRAVERLGGRVGGVVGTMPTTIVPASLGLWAADPARFTDSMAMVPAGMLVNAGFLWSWRELPPRLGADDLATRLAKMTGLSLALWCAGAAVLVGVSHVARDLTAPATIGAASLALTVVCGVAACWTPPPAPRGGRPVTATALLARGGLAAAAIGGSVLVASAGSPLLAGMATVFPAIFLTTMVSLWLAQGEAVPVGAVGPMMLGSASVGAYALLAAALFPTWGLRGAVPAWLLAVLLVSLPAGAWLRRPTPPRS